MYIWYISHPVWAHPVVLGHVNSHRWPQPVGHCLFTPNQSLMCPRWPPWEQPWHQMNNPFTGKWLSKQNTMYRDLWSKSDIPVKLILSIIEYLSNFCIAFVCIIDLGFYVGKSVKILLGFYGQFEPWIGHRIPIRFSNIKFQIYDTNNSNSKI